MFLITLFSSWADNFSIRLFRLGIRSTCELESFFHWEAFDSNALYLSRKDDALLTNSTCLSRLPGLFGCKLFESNWSLSTSVSILSLSLMIWKKKRQYWCPKQFNLIAYKPVVRPWWINWIGFGLMERIWKDIQKGMASECRGARRGNVHDRDRDDSINNTLWSGHILWSLCSSSMRLNCSRSASWNLTIQTCQARENLVLSQNFSDKQSLVTKTTRYHGTSAKCHPGKQNFESLCHQVLRPSARGNKPNLFKCVNKTAGTGNERSTGQPCGWARIGLALLVILDFGSMTECQHKQRHYP